MSVEESDDSKKFNKDYDILNMLNSISNFEVFTPFEVADSIVKLLPEEVFTDPNFKFLDPAVKSGIFLREIIYKLDANLPRTMHTDKDTGKTYDLNNRKERTNHILRNMIYGIAISELTSYVTRRTIYGVMEANVDKSVEYLNSKQIANKLNITETGSDLDFNAFYDHTMFNTEERKGYEKEGNIFYPADETTISTEDTYHPFINETQHPFINQIKEGKMKFDVIIGNPPYQSSDGGHGSSAKPIYNIFIEKSIELEPRYLSMIVPARWYSGGKGLNKFRENMLNDKRVSYLIDGENSNDFFSGVNIEGGICYFLWESNKKDRLVKYKQIKDKNFKERELNTFDVFVRNNISLDILIKTLEKRESKVSDIVSPHKPFGLRGNFSNFSDYGVVIYTKNGKRKVLENLIPSGFKENEYFNMWKVIVGKSNGAAVRNKKVISVPQIIKPNEICTETFIIIGYFSNEYEAKNYMKYSKSKFFRFMLSLRKPSITISKFTFDFIPMQDFNEEWTDEKLYKKYNLTEEEINHIEETIRPME